jgi:Tfp pilus assembly protein PilN
MIRINLLPSDTAVNTSQTDLAILAAIVGGVLLAVIIVLVMFRKNKLSTLETNVAAATNELRKYESIVSQVDSLQQTKNSLEQHRNVIKSLIASTLIYPIFMDTFIASMPKAIWLTNLSTTLNGDLMTLSITASSFSNYAIADWITALESSKSFTKVELGPISSSEQTTGSGSKKTQTILNFQLSCSFRRT